MNAKYQRGELSLLWAAVFIATVTLVAVAALFSMRYERNFFSEMWQRIIRSDAGKTLQYTGQMAQSAVGRESAVASSAIRHCMIDGKVMYSNVECDAKNPTSRKVELHDAQGIEAPKAPVSASQESASQTLQDKMIEKAVSDRRDR